MRSIKNLKFYLTKTGIIKSFNDNKFNLILTQRQWGLTSLLIKYVNQIPDDKTIFFGVKNINIVRDIKRKINHPYCRIQTVQETNLIGRGFDYIICDNFFDESWMRKIILLAPTLKDNGKIILADSGRGLGYQMEYFRNYNIINKMISNNG